MGSEVDRRLERDGVIDSVRRGTIGRREFLRAATATGLTVAAAQTLWAKTAMAQAPKRGGTARVAFASTSPTLTLDPIKTVNIPDLTHVRQLGQELVALGPDLKLEPQLATAWEASAADGSEWVFELRKGVEFHNGKPFTSADVVYSMRRHLTKDSESVHKAQMAQIDEVSADGAHAVRFKLKSPNFEFPVAFTGGRTVVIPEGHTDFINFVGTGGFKLGEFQPGVRTLFVRHENYWNADRVHLDAIETFSILDPTNRINALVTGEADFIVGVDLNALPRLESAANAETMFVRGGQNVHMVMMCDRAPTDSHDFRLAMKHLQDRQRVVDSVYKGYAQIGNDYLLSPSHNEFSREIPVRPYDIDKAKYHLRQAGAENPTIEIFTSTAAGPGGLEQALLFQQTAAAAGVTVNVQQAPAESYWSAIWRKRPIHGSHWNMRPTAELQWSQLYMSTAPENEIEFRDERVDRLVLQVRAERDEAKRMEIWHELQVIAHDEGGHLLAAHPDYIYAHAKTLKGLKPYPLGVGTSNIVSGEDLWLDT